MLWTIIKPGIKILSEYKVKSVTPSSQEVIYSFHTAIGDDGAQPVVTTDLRPLPETPSHQSANRPTAPQHMGNNLKFEMDPISKFHLPANVSWFAQNSKMG